MMQKMGWTEGKGMGKNEDGRVEHVKTVKKSDNLGIGAERRTGDNWLENTNAFDELLKGLNAAQDEVKEPEVREVVKPVMHGRLYHRTKFVRNKLVSNYDEDQLSHILGRKSLKPESRPSSPAVSEQTQSDYDPMTKVQNVSVQDYFAAKMKAKLAKRETDGTEEKPARKKRQPIEKTQVEVESKRERKKKRSAQLMEEVETVEEKDSKREKKKRAVESAEKLSVEKVSVEEMGESEKESKRERKRKRILGKEAVKPEKSKRK
jgi:Pin2-interacting protein X1